MENSVSSKDSRLNVLLQMRACQQENQLCRKTCSVLPHLHDFSRSVNTRRPTPFAMSRVDIKTTTKQCVWAQKTMELEVIWVQLK